MAWRNFVSEYLQTDEIFEDEEFPASLNSIYDNDDMERVPRRIKGFSNCIWRRVGDIEYFVETSEETKNDEPKKVEGQKIKVKNKLFARQKLEKENEM